MLRRYWITEESIIPGESVATDDAGEPRERREDWDEYFNRIWLPAAGVTLLISIPLALALS